MIPCKSAAAFQLSCRKLREHNKVLYFWTFTFVEAQSDVWAMYMWKVFLQWLARWTDGQAKGVRVLELHREHGIHFHFIINRRISVDVVRRVAARWGFGWVDVRVCWDIPAAYLSKYLSKDYRRMYPCGMRRWACIGGFRGSKVRDLKLESRGDWNRQELFGDRRVHIAGIQMVYMLTDFLGPVSRWSDKWREVCRVAAGLCEAKSEVDEWWNQLKRTQGGMSPVEKALLVEICSDINYERLEREGLTLSEELIESGHAASSFNGEASERV